MRRIVFVFPWICSFFFSGCSTLSYLAQAGKGQLALSNRARPIEEVIADSRTEPGLRDLLLEIPRIKQYGVSLGLKPTANYTQYVQLDRPYVVWVVTASPPLQFRARVWSFPLVGSFTYLGWFDEQAAREYAAELAAEENLDTYVRGAPAFSTLGWFRDPVLSSMIRPGDLALPSLVNVILHESLHSTYYVKGQSAFNESVAQFVGDEMTTGYLKGLPQRGALLLSSYRQARERGRQRGRRFRQAYEALDSLYRQPEVSDEFKLKRKNEVISALKEDLKIDDPEVVINNAALIQFRTYGSGQEELKELFLQCGSDWKRFLRVLSLINVESFPAPQTEDFGGIILSVKKDC